MKIASSHCPIAPVLPTENSTPQYGRGLLRRGISSQLMSLMGPTATDWSHL